MSNSLKIRILVRFFAVLPQAMRFLCLLAVAVLGLAAASDPVIRSGFFPPTLLIGNITQTLTVRVYDSQLTTLFADREYAAFFCDIPADVLSLAGDMAVVRLTQQLPPVKTTCVFTMWDVESQKREIIGSPLRFEPFVEDKMPPVAADVVPSFYFADRSERTRVYVSGPYLTEVTKVICLTGGEECTQVEKTETGFSCILPVKAPGSFEPHAPSTFIAVSPHGQTKFTIEALSDFGLTVEAVLTPQLFYGARIAVRLSAPVAPAQPLPWVPVLVSAKTGEIMSVARFTDLRWIGDQRLSARIQCSLCPDGDYYVALGDAVPGRAAPVVSSLAKFSYYTPRRLQ
jgi:hypothetical protein